jgi:hypothetical protein
MERTEQTCQKYTSVDTKIDNSAKPNNEINHATKQLEN